MNIWLIFCKIKIKLGSVQKICRRIFDCYIFNIYFMKEFIECMVMQLLYFFNVYEWMYLGVIFFFFYLKNKIMVKIGCCE